MLEKPGWKTILLFVTLHFDLQQEDGSLRSNQNPTSPKDLGSSG